MASFLGGLAGLVVCLAALAIPTFLLGLLTYGLWQTWHGLPFRRELRELTASSSAGRRRTPPPAIPSTTSEVKPCQA